MIIATKGRGEGNCGTVTDRGKVRNGKPFLVLNNAAQLPSILFVEVRERDVEVMRQIGAAEQQVIAFAGSATVRVFGPGLPPFLELKEQVVGFEPELLFSLGGGCRVVGEGGDGTGLGVQSGR